MDGKTLARIGAIVFVAVAIIATAIEVNRKDETPEPLAAPSRPAAARDPLDDELLRCSQIGEAGARDPACLQAWAASRRRFLGEPPVAPSNQSSPIKQVEPARAPVSENGAR
jgi:conjugative transfer region protein TrbK